MSYAMKSKMGEILFHIFSFKQVVLTVPPISFKTLQLTENTIKYNLLNYYKIQQ